MILMNNHRNTHLYFLQKSFKVFFCIILISSFNSCNVYTFKDVSIPAEIKTIKLSYLENRATYKSPQLSSKLTDALQQKITGQTRLTMTNSDDANYQVSGYISNYYITTSGISGQQAATNRLSVGVHIDLLNTLDNKTQQFDISRDFDFSANLTLQQAEPQLMPDIIKNVSDEIFNRLFSNW